MPKRGNKLVIFGIATLEDVYGFARIKVPYRPKSDYSDGIDCTSTDDVFRLYWRYCEPSTMSSFSTTSRKLPASTSHVDKMITAMRVRHCTHLVLEKGKVQPPWIKELMEEAQRLKIEVVKVVPTKTLPPGIDPDKINYFERQAWQLIYSYMRTLKWPASQLKLEVFSAVGQGKDTSAAHTEQTRVRERKAARLPTAAELKQLRDGEIDVNEFLATGVRLEKTGRQDVYDAQESAIFNQRGIWKHHVWKNNERVARKPTGVGEGDE